MKHKLTFNPDGAEPIVQNADGVAAVRLLNWYNANMSRDDVIRVLSGYAKNTMHLKATDVTAAASGLADAPQTAASIVAAWAAGSTFKNDDHADAIVRDTIIKAVETAKARKAAPSDYRVMAMAKRRRDDANRSQAFWSLSDVIDHAGETNSRNVAIPTVTDANVAKDILPHFERRELEMQQAVADPEGYEGINVRGCLRAVKATIDMLRHAVTSGTSAVMHKPRKLRTPKKKSPAAQVAKLKYLTNWGAIQSINPTRLIGCKTAFLYDTKARKLVKFTSDDGIAIRGSHLVANAVSKKIRKPDDEVPKFVSGTAAFVRREFEAIKTKATAARTMVNSNMIIIRAI